MTKELRAGISFSEESTQTIIAEFRADGADIKFVDEFVRMPEQRLTHLPETLVKQLGAFGRLHYLAITLETGNAITQQFPVDGTLTESELESHLDWEWKNYLPEYSSALYQRKSRKIPAAADSSAIQYLSSVTPESLIYEITEALSSVKLSTHEITLGIDTAEKVARFIHPEFKSKTVALLGISPLRLDVTVYERGVLRAYKYGLGFSPQSAVEYLATELLEYLPETMYVYGSGVSYQWLKALKSSLGLVAPLNPFRKFRIIPEVKNFSKFLGHEHRFCGCIGSILEIGQPQTKK